MRQKIQIIRAPDGVRLACARSGSGPPLVRAGTWMTHVEHDWDGPLWSHWLRFLSSRHELIRYDQRGCGLSDLEPDRVAFDAWVADLEAVVDALDLERFTLLGVSQAASVSVEYAARHPERVERLVLYGSLAAGWKYGSDSDRKIWGALRDLAAYGWGEEHAVFRELFGRLFAPEADAEQRAWFSDMLLRTMHAANVAATIDQLRELFVIDRLKHIRCPTLVIHAERDAVIPLVAARVLVGGIPDAELVTLDSCNHILLENEPAWERFKQVFHAFLGAPDPGRTASPVHDALTERQQRVLGLIAEGLSNREIAERLGISEKTVRNHVSCIFDKLGVHSRARAIVLARESGLS